jgi:hypothetical protein
MNPRQAAQFALTVAWNFLAIHGGMTLAGAGDVRTSAGIAAIVAGAALIVTMVYRRRGIEMRF